jgi:hypothetical protein
MPIVPATKAANALRGAGRLGRPRLWFVLSLTLFTWASPAFALTAGDVLDHMTDRERANYISGAVDMAMFAAAVDQKNGQKSECILNWYYGKDAKGPQEVLATFTRYRDKSAPGLISVLINRACGQ